MPPGQVARAVASGDASPWDVLEAAMLELADPVRCGAIAGWLWRERDAARRRRVERLAELMRAAEVATGETRERLIAELERIEQRDNDEE